jgi:Lrp/AsnC family transcriptional regulator, leucine-responsive regulatory protein
MKPKRDDIGLDKIDRQILKLLQLDCKTALAKLGDQVGLSAPSVVERIRRLETEGFIKGYHALLDAHRLGIDITAFIGVTIDRLDATNDIEQQVSAIDDVLECHHVTGEHNFFLKVKTHNTETLEVLIRRLRSISGITQTHTSVVFSTPVERTVLNV